MATKNQRVDTRALIADCRNLQKEATLHLCTSRQEDAYNDLSIATLQLSIQLFDSLFNSSTQSPR